MPVSGALSLTADFYSATCVSCSGWQQWHAITGQCDKQMVKQCWRHCSIAPPEHRCWHSLPWWI